MLFPSHLDTIDLDWRWPDFLPRELACKCGGKYCDGAYWHCPDFLDALQALREEMAAPIAVTSGHRCGRWNAAVGGAPRSRHLKIAADVRIAGHDRFKLRDAAVRRGFTGIGLARTFIHLDRRAVPATWYYEGSEPLWQS